MNPAKYFADGYPQKTFRRHEACCTARHRRVRRAAERLAVHLRAGRVFVGHRRLHGPAHAGRGFLHDDRSFGLRRDDRRESPSYVELAAACAADRPLFPNILAAAAMLLIRRQKEVKPGDAIRDVIAEFYPRAARIASLSDAPVSVGRAASVASRRREEHRLASGRPGHQRRIALPGSSRRRRSGADSIASGGSTCTALDGRRGWREIRSMNQLAAAVLATAPHSRTKAQSRARGRQSP